MNRLQPGAMERKTPFFSAEQLVEIKKDIDVFLDGKIVEWRDTVPYAKHLEEDNINMDYYRQTLIEHCWRIRSMRTVQTYALHKMAQVNAEAAQLYAEYEGEEMLHDLLYMQDAKAAGITEEQLFATEPSFYTRMLTGFLYQVANHENVIGVVAYSYLVEYTTQKLTPKQVESLKKSMGDDMTLGQQSHLNTDLVEDHSQEMFDILALLLTSHDDVVMLKQYLSEIQEILKLFFVDLYDKYTDTAKAA
ncbi:iron-containing redox enzyme family protein [Vibrio sp. 10N.261.46.E11]|uniref:hypothetical protein n=1 Tax=Vibrio sp. 10N.261.46.E11 TaxID=3229662 RepID=UPI00354E73F6